MKVAVILILLVAVGLWAVYYFSGYRSFDPTKEGLEAKKAIEPGMSFTEVLEIAGEKAKYQEVSREKASTVGSMATVLGPAEEEGFVLVAAPKQRFDRKRVTGLLADGQMPYGFVLSYMFSNSVAFRVVFDETGSVLSVDDEATMADLLQMR
jgi:hypothetical protein